MGMFVYTESCPVHVSHGDSGELPTFAEATGATMAVILDCAPVEQFTALIREWLDQERQGSATIEFENDFGNTVFLTYTV